MRPIDVSIYGDLARPERLPLPNCRVMLVCGPPGAGKSTYVRQHKAIPDNVIDYDDIAKELGYGLDRPPEATAIILTERNLRLGRLGKASRDKVAWFIINAPSQKLRGWWQNQLNVRQPDTILLVPPRAELIRRIRNDPDRRGVIVLHERLIHQWFDRERDNNPGRIVRGCDASGWPIDQLHSWNG